MLKIKISGPRLEDVEYIVKDLRRGFLIRAVKIRQHQQTGRYVAYIEIDDLPGKMV